MTDPSDPSHVRRDLVRLAVDAAGAAVVTVGRGTGLIVAPDRVLTNAHNLTGDEVGVRFADGSRVPARVAGADVDGDLAVLEVTTADHAPAGLADDDRDPPALGDPVVAMARPRHRGLMATTGTIAATGARFRGPRGTLIAGAVEHDARLPRGASGGPVVGADGTVIAIDTHRRRDGFYVARVVTAELRHLLDELAQGRAPDRPSLGIAVAPAHVARRLRSAVGLDDRDGVLVREVDPDGAAARAGLRSGDLIVAVDDAPLASTDDLQAALARDGVERLRLGVVRGAEELEVVVEL